ncbi:MAG: ketol-acid reductoisomerase, partial [Thermoprotei archaeon]
LVGGLMELIRKGFEVLVEEGYQPEVAYFEVCNEAKLIMDLIYAGGLTGMLRGVSDTAKYGGLTVGPKVIDDRVKENMKEAARRVKDGSFAKEWIEECSTGRRRLRALMEIIEKHQLEVVGREMRKLAGIEG